MELAGLFHTPGKEILGCEKGNDLITHNHIHYY